MGGKVGENPAALRAAFFSLSSKNRRGRSNAPPPSRALVNIASNDLACHIPDQINGFQVTVVRYADDTQIAVTGPREKNK